MWAEESRFTLFQTDGHIREVEDVTRPSRHHPQSYFFLTTQLFLVNVTFFSDCTKSFTNLYSEIKATIKIELPYLRYIQFYKSKQMLCVSFSLLQKQFTQLGTPGICHSANSVVFPCWSQSKDWDKLWCCGRRSARIKTKSTNNGKRLSLIQKRFAEK